MVRTMVFLALSWALVQGLRRMRAPVWMLAAVVMILVIPGVLVSAVLG